MAPVMCSESPAAVRIGHVEDIQELHRASPAFVPERYIRAPEERPAAAAAAAAAAAVAGPGDVPVVDMSKLGSKWHAADELQKLAAANEERDRLSVVTFYAPSYDVEVGPIAELVRRDQRCMYKRYNHGDYSRHYVTNKLQGKKTLEFAKIHQLD